MYMYVKIELLTGLLSCILAFMFSDRLSSVALLYELERSS